ncbi:hypothetical protein BST97_14755 [Nonlabens spongiae]|uniref:Lipoprotein n=1 Tax=Nonlabens spongiae TaxID=331648 RepID=A0A1W6MNL0_9FLAO|nr:hypothetical protein [Nonlabens spongiae]ARN79142.1 hypothetical protein BST97_14755 [Nonlabens spongiae]
MKQLLILASLLFLLNSCASYSRKRNKKYHQKLEQNDLKKLEGIYEIIPNRRYYKDSIVIFSKNEKPYQRLHSAFNFKNVQIDSTARYSFKIFDIDEKSINCSLIENDSILFTKSIAGKLKKNGTFHFKKHEVHVFELPYILGSLEHSKVRIGLTIDNQLFVEDAEIVGGGFLIILFSGWRDYSSTLGYNRIGSTYDLKLTR